MGRYLFFVFCFWVSAHASAQYGLRLSYSHSSAPTWQDMSVIDQGGSKSFFFGSGFTVGVDYWVRLPELRIEFYPEISYSAYKNSLLLQAESLAFKSQVWTVGVNTQFYLFDLKGDCDCPTFSKQGSLTKKGFFMTLKPGAQYHRKYTNGAFSDASIAPSLGLGLGLDIGMSDLITLTPFAIYNIAFADHWSGLSDQVQDPTGMRLETSDFRQVSVGVRIGIRGDH